MTVFTHFAEEDSRNKRDVDRLDEFSMPVATSEPALLTCGQVWGGVQSRFKDIRAIELEYTSSFHNVPTAEREAVSQYTHFALKNELRFLENANLDSTNNPVGPSSIQSFDGTRYSTFRPRHKYAVIKSEEERRLYQDNYLGIVGIPTNRISVWTALALAMSWLGRAMSHSNLAWKVLPNLSLVDSTLCHVLETRNGSRRLWVDTSNCFAVRLDMRFSRIGGLAQREWPVSYQCASTLR